MVAALSTRKKDKVTSKQIADIKYIIYYLAEEPSTRTVGRRCSLSFSHALCHAVRSFNITH